MPMNWNDKSAEIAIRILDKMENGVLNSYTRDDVLKGLREAALSGMEFECDAWCHGKSEEFRQCCDKIKSIITNKEK